MFGSNNYWIFSYHDLGVDSCRYVRALSIFGLQMNVHHVVDRRYREKEIVFEFNNGIRGSFVDILTRIDYVFLRTERINREDGPRINMLNGEFREDSIYYENNLKT